MTWPMSLMLPNTNLLKIVSVKPKHQNTSMTCFSCSPVGLCPVCSVTHAWRWSLCMLSSELVFVGSMDSSGHCDNVWCQARTSAYGHVAYHWLWGGAGCFSSGMVFNHNSPIKSLVDYVFLLLLTPEYKFSCVFHFVIVFLKKRNFSVL